MSRSFLRALAVVGILFTTCLLNAQSTGGRIIGRVTDTSGAVVPGAKITLTNEATGVNYESVSSGAGDFAVLQVPVGVYTVTADHGSFKKYVRKGVRLELNQVLNLEIAMQLGAANEVVNVTGEAPLIDTSSSQLGTAVDSKTVTGLPLDSRDTYQLLQIQPGVTSIGGSDLFYGSNTAGAVSVNGARGRANNFSVNGGESNDLFVNAPGVQPSPDAIQEFRVITNTFDAEYGRNSGSVINVVTKSGTNAWHGSLFEFFRNQGLNARGYFDIRRPDLKQNDFGGTFGGPIKKDKSFFFVSYEGKRQVQGQTSDPVVVPTDLERIGNFSESFASAPFAGTLKDDTLAQILNARCGLGATAGDAWSTLFPGNIIPQNCLDPVAVDLLNAYVPHANRGGNIFQDVPNGRSDGNQFTIKYDHNFNQNHQFNAYYYYNDGNDDVPFSHFESFSPNVLPGFGAVTATRSQQVNLSHVWTINPQSVNEFRFTYFRNSQGEFFHPKKTNLVTDSCTTVGVANCFNGQTDTPGVFTSDPKLGITPNLGPTREGVPFISVSGGFTIGNNFEGEIPQTGNTYQWSDNFTRIFGKHTTKFGVDFRMQHFDQTLFFDPNGDFSFFGGGENDLGAANLFGNYLIGLPDSFLQGSAQASRYRTNSIYLFAQDSWKLKPNFTVNYGLRYEINTPFKDLNKRVQAFRPGQATTQYPCTLQDPNQITNYGGADCNPGGVAQAVFPLGLVVPGDHGVAPGFAETVYTAFAPRVGIAWSPGWKDNWLTGGQGKTSVRAGFGVFYNPIEQLVLEQLGAQPPFGGSTLISEDYFQAPFALQSCTAPCTVGNNSGVAPNPFNGFLSPAPGTPTDWSTFRPILLFGNVPKHQNAQYTMQYNFNIERELRKDLAVQIGYVGSQGRHLLATRDLNFGNPQTCLDLHQTSVTSGDASFDCGQFFADSSFVIPAGTQIAPQGLHLPYGSVPFISGGTVLANDINLVGLRQYSSPFCEPTTGAGCPADGIPVFSSIFSQETGSNSTYNAFQAQLEKRFSKGLQFLAAYTLSRSEDDASTFEQILNPICNSCNRSLSLFDTRHRFVLSYLWDIPVPHYQGAKGTLLNGWAISGITTLQSGFPIRILSADDQELMNSFDFELPGKPDQIANFHTADPRDNHFCANGTGPAFGNNCITDLYAFDPNAFTSAAFGTLGTAKRSICCGPGIKNFDFSIQKITKFKETQAIEFRAEFFNLFNTTQFLNPDGNITDGTDFGKVKRARAPRQIQFALKYSF
jgi:hypothetical protein